MASTSEAKLSKAERTTHTSVDTVSFTVKEAQAWEVPSDIQRGVKVNKKVMELANQIKNDGGVLPGILTMGILEGRRYLIDGLQRREAFFISEKDVGYADVRTCYFKTRAEMGEEFVRLNSQLVKMTPDDILRGLEAAVPFLRQIRQACPFVAYGRIRTGDGARTTMLSMSTTLRCWAASRYDLPHQRGSALELARELQEDETRKLIGYLTLTAAAWGRDEQYYRMWSAINLILSMWLYRRTVTDPPQSGYSRPPKLAPDLFKKCLMSLSADRSYMDWLIGRNVGERDRSPCYNRMKAIFTKRIHEETGKKEKLPQPEWAH